MIVHRVRKFSGVALCLALLAPTAGAAAQPVTATAEPAWSVAEVTVTARSPRMWKLTKGASTVWVLGYIEPLPKGLKWNTAPRAHAMDGANRVILPAMASIGIFEALRSAARSHLARGQTLDAELPPDLRDRYHRVLAQLGRDPSHYQKEKAAWAALMLELDLQHARDFTAAEPMATVRRLARARRIPVAQAGSYDGGAILKELVGLPEVRGEIALADAVNGASFALEHVGPAALAWAAGDLTTVRDNLTPDSTPSTPLRQTPTYQKLDARSVDDTVAALNSALERPGTTVALLSLTNLARRNGALDRLRQEGVSVTEPAE